MINDPEELVTVQITRQQAQKIGLRLVTADGKLLKIGDKVHFYVGCVLMVGTVAAFKQKRVVVSPIEAFDTLVGQASEISHPYSLEPKRLFHDRNTMKSSIQEVIEKKIIDLEESIRVVDTRSRNLFELRNLICHL